MPPSDVPTAVSETVIEVGEDLTPDIPLFLHLVRGADCVALVDSGLPQSRALVRRLLEEADGLPLRYVCTTHAHHDHIGNHRLLREEGALVVAAHGSRAWMADPDRNLREFAFHHPHVIGESQELRDELEATFDGEVVVDLAVDGGTVLDLGGGVRLEAVRADGHLHTELAWLETRSRTLILGDVVTGVDWPFFHGHVSPSSLLASLDRLERLVREREVQTVVFSHYELRDRAGFSSLVETVRQHVRDVRGYVRAAVSRGPASLEDVWSRVTQLAGKEPEFRGLAMVRAHLDELLAGGEIRLVGPETYACPEDERKRQ